MQLAVQAKTAGMTPEKYADMKTVETVEDYERVRKAHAEQSTAS